MSAPSVIYEYAFSGSLCRICEFQTENRIRYCLTVFNLSNYNHLHFPHYEYKYLIGKLNAYLSTQARLYTACDSDDQKLNGSVLTIKQIPFSGDIKIKFGGHRLEIGPVTVNGLVKFTPFTFADVFSANENHFTCDSRWDICICKTCSVFNRLIEFEAVAITRFPHRKPVNVILFEHEQ